MGSFGRSAALCAAAALGAVLSAGPAAAELKTDIDLNYTYEQENLGGDVSASTQFNQKYQVKLETTISSSLDFVGAVAVELDDKWATNAATTSRLTPSLELGVKGAPAAVKFTYSGVVSTTDAYHEDDEDVTYANNADLDVELTPGFWPEIKLKLQNRHEFEEQRRDATTRTGQLQVRDDVFGVRLEYALKLGEQAEVLPQSATTETTEWSGKATYKEVLYGGTEFEAAYEIKETYGETRNRDVFTGLQESYNQNIKSRLKNSLDLTPRLTVGASWEYMAEQDVLRLAFDHRVENKYQLDLRYDMFNALKITGGAKRDTELIARTEGQEDKRVVTDALKGAVDFTPVTWLRLGGKVDLKTKGSIDENSGGSEDRVDDENYELIAKNKIGTFWDLTLDGTHRRSYTDGLLASREWKLKADLRLKYGALAVDPSYEAARTTSWDLPGEPAKQNSSEEFKIKFDYRMQLLDLLTATFTHEYDLKDQRAFDDVRNYDQSLQMNETTTLNLVLAELFEGLRLEGAIERKGSDTQGDPDPQVVEVSYALKLDWKLETLTLNSTFQYSDKGDAFDELAFGAKVNYKIDQFDLTSEYQYKKTYADETDENRKLNLKLSYKF